MDINGNIDSDFSFDGRKLYGSPILKLLVAQEAGMLIPRSFLVKHR